MKKLNAVLLILVFSIIACIAQTNNAPTSFVVSSNSAMVELSPTAPLPPDMAVTIATSLGIPSWVLAIIPVKLVVWLGLLIWAAPYIGRAWHSFQAGGGIKGITGSVLFGTNTPKEIVQATGQPIVTAPVPPKPLYP